MSDKIIGIAVLDRTQSVEYLTVMCAYPDGTNHASSIPVLQKGSSKQVTNQWEYVIRGDIFDVTPSLRIRTTRPSLADPSKQEEVELFHNDGSWSIPFKEFIKLEESDPMFYVQASDLFRSLNPKRGDHD